MRPQSYERCIRDYLRQNHPDLDFTIEMRRHIKVRLYHHRRSRLVIASKSPSDHREFQNFKREVRRVERELTET